jgi:hypothetical protein
MIANAAQALDQLGDLPTMTVAKNTVLHRVTDRLAALSHHGNMICFYGQRGVKITTDWHTASTWRRLTQLTPVTTHREFLRFIDQPNGDRVLYEPGLAVDEEGHVLNPMMPSRQIRIESALRECVPAIRRYARTAVERWDEFREEDCECIETSFCRDEDDELADHIFTYHLDGTPTLPWRWRSQAERRLDTCREEAVTEPTRKEFATWLMKNVLPHAVWVADPKFKFHYPNPHQPRS